MDWNALAAEFPREAVHWRAQTLTQSGDKALALAYLDARDVQDRLDDVCGPANWQSEYHETAKGRVLCRIGIRTEDGWVWKGDGAGATDVEGEKGGISDAFKRAAVHWGIGRYLYRLDAVWAPCETYERNGKKNWKAWKGSPWDHVRRASPPPQSKPQEQPRPAPLPDDDRTIANRLIAAIGNARTLPDLARLWGHDKTAEAMANVPEPMRLEVENVHRKRKEALGASNAQAPDERAA